MTAGGFLQQKQRHPLAMAVAVAINVAAIGAVMLAKTDYIREIPTILIGRNIPLPPPEPKADPPKPRHRVPVSEPVFQPKPVTGQSGRHGPDIATTDHPIIDVPRLPPLEPGPRIEPKQPDPAPPVLVGAQPDPAGTYQPPYPPSLLRTGVEGKVVVKVLIGSDGRVHQVVIVSADDPKFADATERQALSRWRFRPATRDGVPVESWKQLTVRFEIKT